MTTEEENISLRAYLEMRFNGLAEAQAVAFATHTTVHKMEHDALIQATINMNRRLEEMNEFRAQLSEERRSYMTRAMFNAAHDALTLKVEALMHSADQRLNLLERAQAGALGSIWALGVVLSLITVGVNVLFHFWGK